MSKRLSIEHVLFEQTKRSQFQLNVQILRETRIMFAAAQSRLAVHKTETCKNNKVNSNYYYYVMLILSTNSIIRFPKNLTVADNTFWRSSISLIPSSLQFDNLNRKLQNRFQYLCALFIVKILLSKDKIDWKITVNFSHLCSNQSFYTYLHSKLPSYKRFNHELKK